MTIEEMNKYGFSGDTKCIYDSKQHNISSVDFSQNLIGIPCYYEGCEPEDIIWLRCENVDIIEQTH